MTLLIKEILKLKPKNQLVTAKGWVKNFRANKFISLNDGSTVRNIQCVIDFENFDESIIKKITSGTSLSINGKLVKSLGSGQEVEILVENIKIYGESNAEKYPIQPKKHSFEFLRENAHLRIRTSTFGAIMRIRSKLSYAVHKFFQEENFQYVNTPIITSNDAEGAGEMFRVTTLDPKSPPLEKNNVDFTKDFFSKKTHLTVSGQLEAESYALGLGKVYTFGPTFRAENSNTTRHLSEFWMIEPEMAFFSLEDNINLAEKFVKYILSFVIENCIDDLSFLEERLYNEEKNKPKNERNELKLTDKLKFVIDNEFERISYSNAFEILKNCSKNKKKKFKFLVKDWGMDFQSEHERYLVEKHFNKPVIIFDYPSKSKAFYMRLNDDKLTVAAMDVLFPGIGEIIGGSQREERINILKNRMNQFGVSSKDLWWYKELRSFGTVPHSGFGLGFERLVLFATGMTNIRDVIPFPRTPNNALF
tara:strand:- start:35 stop:1462 length:1428 start_codon:yes stop_codon:yes gene_type:complete